MRQLKLVQGLSKWKNYPKLGGILAVTTKKKIWGEVRVEAR